MNATKIFCTTLNIGVIGIVASVLHNNNMFEIILTDYN